MKTIVVSTQEIVFRDNVGELISSLDADKFHESQQNSEKVTVNKIIYKSGGHKVVGFIVEPKDQFFPGKLPCIIYNRGGSGEFGTIGLGHLFLPLARMAQWGYVVITTQYSGNGGSEGIDEFGGRDLQDILNLYKVLQSHSRANLKKIGMYGHSRGGMMSYLSLSKVKWIKAVVAIGSPSNLIRQAEERPEMNEVMKKMFGGSLAEKKKRSALFWTSSMAKKTPLLIMHGSADWRVNPLDSIELSQKLYEHKIPHRFVLFEGNDHSLTENKEEAENLARKWFGDYLAKEKSLPNLHFHGA